MPLSHNQHKDDRNETRNLPPRYCSLSFDHDVGLANLRNLTGMKRMKIVRPTKVNDRALAQFAGMTELEVLELAQTPVTSAGVVHLKPLKKLRQLNLFDAPVDDAGIKYLAELPELRALNLGCTRVTAAGVPFLMGLTKLEELDLSMPAVTREVLKSLEKLENLERVGYCERGPDGSFSGGARPVQRWSL